MFLKSSASAVKSIFGLGRGVRASMVVPRAPRAPRRSGLSGRVFRGIGQRLLDFAVQRVTAQSGIVLLQLEFLGFKLFVSRRGVTRRGRALFARLGALDGDDLSGHELFLLLGFLFRLFLFGLDFGDADGID